MKRVILISILAFFSSIIMFNAEGTDFRFYGIAVLEFRNETDQAITVVMNNQRESYPIAAHSQATFLKANIGDAPTFHVYDSKGTNLFSRNVGMVGAKTTFKWDGSKF
jgi:hypothetical protein